MDVAGQGIGMTTERVLLKADGEPEDARRDFFPQLRAAPPSILSRKGISRKRQSVIVSKELGGNENFYPEAAKG